MRTQGTSKIGSGIINIVGHYIAHCLHKGSVSIID